MSSFRDLLNNPLPSAYMESDDYSDEIDDTEEGCAGSSCESDDYSDDTEEGCGNNKSEHGDYDDYDDDYDDDDYDHHHHHHHHDDYDHHHHHHHHHDDEYYHHHHDDDHHHHHHDYYEGEGDYDDDDLDDDYDDDDLDGISDDITDDISVDDIEDEVDAEVGDTVDDDELEVPVDDFTPEEEQEVEDETSLVATPIILKDELTAEEYADFGESVDADIAVDEGFLLESDIDIFSEDVMEESIKPMRFSKDSVLKARTNQIRWIVMRSLARKRNDPSLYKLEKAYKIRRKIKAQFEAKYGAKADQITRKYIARLKSSKSPVLARVGKKLGVKR